MPIFVCCDGKYELSADKARQFEIFSDFMPDDAEISCAQASKEHLRLIEEYMRWGKSYVPKIQSGTIFKNLRVWQWPFMDMAVCALRPLLMTVHFLGYEEFENVLCWALNYAVAREKQAPQVDEEKSPQVGEEKSPQVEQKESPQVEESRAVKVYEAKSSAPHYPSLLEAQARDWHFADQTFPVVVTCDAKPLSFGDHALLNLPGQLARKVLLCGWTDTNNPDDFDLEALKLIEPNRVLSLSIPENFSRDVLHALHTGDHKRFSFLFEKKYVDFHEPEFFQALFYNASALNFWGKLQICCKYNKFMNPNNLSYNTIWQKGLCIVCPTSNTNTEDLIIEFARMHKLDFLKSLEPFWCNTSLRYGFFVGYPSKFFHEKISQAYIDPESVKGSVAELENALDEMLILNNQASAAVLAKKIFTECGNVSSLMDKALPHTQLLETILAYPVPELIRKIFSPSTVKARIAAHKAGLYTPSGVICDLEEAEYFCGKVEVQPHLSLVHASQKLLTVAQPTLAQLDFEKNKLEVREGMMTYVADRGGDIEDEAVALWKIAQSLRALVK